MRPFWHRLRLQRVALACLLTGLSNPSVAYAYIGGGFGYGGELGYGTPIGMPVAWPGPNYLFVHHQYFELTVSGLSALCEAEPLLCDSSEQAQILRRLRIRRNTGLGLSLGGFGTALGVPLGVTIAACSGRQSVCKPNWRIMTGGVLLGALIGIAGVIVTPGQQSLVTYVNNVNKRHPGTPITIHPSLVGGMAPGFMFDAAY